MTRWKTKNSTMKTKTKCPTGSKRKATRKREEEEIFRRHRYTCWRRDFIGNVLKIYMKCVFFFQLRSFFLVVLFLTRLLFFFFSKELYPCVFLMEIVFDFRQKTYVRRGSVYIYSVLSTAFIFSLNLLQKILYQKMYFVFSFKIFFPSPPQKKKKKKKS